MTNACVLLADGFEEIEAITVIDVLRRGSVEVAVVGVHEREVRGSHHIVVRADTLLNEVETQDWDLVFLPGGLAGARQLRDAPGVQKLLRRQAATQRKISAICAGPIALEPAGVLKGRRATSYPGFEQELGSLGEYLSDRVVVDGNLITSRAPGSAMELALQLVALLVSAEKADALAKSMLVR